MPRVLESVSRKLFVKFVKPAAAGAAPVADVSFRSKFGWNDPTPAGSAPVVRPCPSTNQEANDEITQSTRRDRRSDADGDSRDDAHGRAMEPAAAVSRWHTLR